MTSSLLLAGRMLFASEIKAAQQLGFQLQFHVADDAVFVRAQPTTARARAACLRATGERDKAIQSHCHYDAVTEVADALREAISAALSLARAVT
jgi:hypothetical protein